MSAAIPTIRVRMAGRTLRENAPLADNPYNAYEALRRVLRRAPQEELWVLFLNMQNQIIGRQMITRGVLNQVKSLPREIFTGALLAGAGAVILAHNHPSGSLTPSEEDLEFTRTIKEAGAILCIAVHDHLIISPVGFISLRQRGLM